MLIIDRSNFWIHKKHCLSKRFNCNWNNLINLNQGKMVFFGTHSRALPLGEIAVNCSMLLAPSESGTDWQSVQLKLREVSSKSITARRVGENEKERIRGKEQERESDGVDWRTVERSVVLTTTCRVVLAATRSRNHYGRFSIDFVRYFLRTAPVLYFLIIYFTYIYNCYIS